MVHQVNHIILVIPDPEINVEKLADIFIKISSNKSSKM